MNFVCEIFQQHSINFSKKSINEFCLRNSSTTFFQFFEKVNQRTLFAKFSIMIFETNNDNNETKNMKIENLLYVFKISFVLNVLHIDFAITKTILNELCNDVIFVHRFRQSTILSLYKRSI